MCSRLFGKKSTKENCSKLEVQSVMVTGANRGIGLELVKQLVSLPNPPKYVFATYRSKDTVQSLEDIRNACETSKVVLIHMDVTKSEELEAARQTVEDAVGDNGLTLLINNAGAMKFAGFPDVTEDNMNFHFTTNTNGPLMILKEMLPLLQKAASGDEKCMAVSRAAVLNISSMGGSCGAMDGPQPTEFLPLVGYRTSKAALNMAMRMVAQTLKDQGILVVQMCPGWVKTDLGTDRGELTTEESVSCILNTLPQLDASNTGTFVDRNGNRIPY